MRFLIGSRDVASPLSRSHRDALRSPAMSGIGIIELFILVAAGLVCVSVPIVIVAVVAGSKRRDD